VATYALDVSMRRANAGRPCVSGNKQDVEKARFWRGAIREAARSGVSIREFCRRRQLRIAGGVDEATLRAVLAAGDRGVGTGR
jgi:hypothetical protein